MTNIPIREATAADIANIAQVHVNSWRETYPGIVSAEFLQNLTAEKMVERWEKALRETQSPWKTFVVEEGGTIKGFVKVGKSRKPEFVYNGEIYALYLLKEVQGRGLGRALFQKAIGNFMQEGISSMYLWVLKDNPTIEFYRHMGGKEIARQPLNIGGTDVEEIAMAWEGLGNERN
jgi:ribosomal protein S18 acetylase RimI-like enzyme